MERINCALDTCAFRDWIYFFNWSSSYFRLNCYVTFIFIVLKDIKFRDYIVIYDKAALLVRFHQLEMS